MKLTASWPEGSPDTKDPEQKGLNEVRVVTECKTEHFLFNLIITEEPPVGPHSLFRLPVWNRVGGSEDRNEKRRKL